MKGTTATPLTATTTGGTTTTEFPLLFTFRELVAGNGFVAAVEASGRALLVRESEKNWWLYGVEPGGVGEGGQTPNEANLAFNSSIHGVLADIAEDASSFEDFKAAVKGFFGEIDRTDEARWTQARASLRNGAPVEEPFVQRLRRETGEAQCEVRIAQLDAPAQARPQMNSGEPEIALESARTDHSLRGLQVARRMRTGTPLQKGQELPQVASALQRKDVLGAAERRSR